VTTRGRQASDARRTATVPSAAPSSRGTVLAPTLSRLIAPLLAIALVATWLTVYLLWPTPFWASDDDYAYLALAHALHFEATLRGGDVSQDGGLMNHPGLPFYVASWLALRASALFAGGKDAIAYALSQPDGFFLATRIIAGLITAAAIAGIWYLMAALAAPWRLLAILGFFAASPASFRYGFTFLGNETFALPLSVLLFWSLRYVVTSPPQTYAPWLVLGAVAAVAYTVKLLYLDILVAAIAVALVDSWWTFRRSNLLFIFRAVQRIGLIATAFVGVAVALLLVAIGRKGVASLLAFHASIFTHTGVYGSGGRGVASVEAVYQAFANSISSMPLPYLCFAAVALLVVTLAAQARARSLDRAIVIWTVAAITATIAAAAAVLKHYDTHYVTAVSAVLPFVLAPVLSHRRWRWVVAAGIFASLCFTAAYATTQLSEQSRFAAAMAEDETRIAAMPLLPAQARLWTYRVPSEHFAAAFVAAYSGVRSIQATLADPARQDFSSYSQVDRSYRYIVLDKHHFPDGDSVRRAKGSLEPTQSLMVQLGANDKIHVLKSTIVVERATD